MKKMIAKAVVMFSVVSLFSGMSQLFAADSAAENKRNKIHSAVQKICAVSGEELPTDGEFISIVDAETKERFFVCCEGCKSEKPDPKFVEQIHANQVKAQKVCLVMTDNEVGEKSKSTVLEGVRIFICCPPCTKKMAAAPEKYLKALDDLYAAALKNGSDKNQTLSRSQAE